MPSPATLAIQVDKPLHSIPPRFYGLMTEGINYSYDGGLYAEMVRNRTTLYTLGGTNPASTNTIEAPKRVFPVESTIKVSPSFSDTVPAYTVQVLVLKTR